jgi:hypothetical protein
MGRVEQRRGKHTLLNARLLRLVDDELLQVLLLDVGHLGNVDVAAA